MDMYTNLAEKIIAQGTDPKMDRAAKKVMKGILKNSSERGLPREEAEARLRRYRLTRARTFVKTAFYLEAYSGDVPATIGVSLRGMQEISLDFNEIEARIIARFASKQYDRK